jgi:SAM-dependent methyltransferase
VPIASAPPAESVFDIYYRIETHHWWFVARRAIVLRLLRRALACPGGDARRLRVADIGTGCGATLADLGRNYDAVGVDASSEAVDYSLRRGARALQGALPGPLPFAPVSLDAVLALDVIEHVADDRAAVRAMTDLLRRGGVLLLTVPAYRWLWTGRDDYHEHKRRYTAPALRSLLRSAGVEIQMLSYFNTLLFPLALLERLTKRLLRLDRIEADLATPPRPVNAAMTMLFRIEELLLPWLVMPFGLSIVALARKRGTADDRG